jgi:adenylate cyclase
LIRSYKSAFILLFLVLLVVTVFAVAFNAYRRAAEVSLELSARTLAEISEKAIQRTISIFDAARADLEVDAVVLGAGDIVSDQDELLRLFWRQTQLTPQILAVFVGDRQGSFVQARKLPQPVTRVIDRSTGAPRERLIYRDSDYRPIAHITGDAAFDPRARPWYGVAKPDGRVRVSQVYRFSSTQELGVTAVLALPGGEKAVRAVLGADIGLDSLSDFLAELNVAKGGVAMIVDGDDRLVAFPQQLRLKTASVAQDEGPPPVSALSDQRLVDAYLAAKAGGTRPVRVGGRGPGFSRLDGASYIAHVAGFPAPLRDWRLFLVVPQSSLLSAAHRLLSESVVISLIILAAAIFAVYMLAARFFEPVQRLARNTQLIRELRFAQVQPVRSRFREIQIMNDAICRMEQTLKAVAKLVPADLARQWAQSDEDLGSRGEVRELTLFFAGLPSLSQVYRRLTLERLMQALTGRLELHTRVIVREGGTVDKFMGDRVVAFWGAPLPVQNGPERACRTAIQCQRIDQEESHQRGVLAELPPSLFAIHSGPAIVGNIGSALRLTRTVLGENVELVAEVERLNQRYGTRILVTGAARQEIAEGFWWRKVDVLSLPDLELDIELFELIEERSVPLGAAKEAFIARYEAGLAHVLAAEWEPARTIFEELRREYPADLSVDLMLRRCVSRGTGTSTPLKVGLSVWGQS